ncbi:hypothetical protein [cf. Phormidesmis sp. LEGE 11477]|uniref:hypothetical protein n=1 Tax=cf. Phormidesmis sp. LEGE 11477 TaxID=1828680 RepID=UPI00187FFE99|nr:hypothetical protein [cf. Phormidesmis sp. LEGE 11477]MBE9063168.1 hypothetical protein [cf. Phormidesmis sp. LEGE 11477]
MAEISYLAQYPMLALSLMIRIAFHTVFLTTVIALLADNSALALAELLTTAFSMSDAKPEVKLETNPKAKEYLPETLRMSIRTIHAQYLGESLNNVQIVSYRSRIWNDSCLGISSVDEICLPALTEGWIVEVTAGDQSSSSFYHADATGNNIRFASSRTDQPPSEDLPETIQSSVRAIHARYLGVSVENVHVISHRPQTWSDSCLGLGGPAESCLSVLIEGWIVEVADLTEDSDRLAFYHTDSTGESIRRSTNRISHPPTDCPDHRSSLRFS